MTLRRADEAGNAGRVRAPHNKSNTQSYETPYGFDPRNVTLRKRIQKARERRGNPTLPGDFSVLQKRARVSGPGAVPLEPPPVHGEFIASVVTVSGEPIAIETIRFNCYSNNGPLPSPNLSSVSQNGQLVVTQIGWIARLRRSNPDTSRSKRDAFVYRTNAFRAVLYARFSQGCVGVSHQKPGCCSFVQWCKIWQNSRRHLRFLRLSIVGTAGNYV